MFAKRVFNKYFSSGRMNSLVAMVAVTTISMSLQNVNRNKTFCDSQHPKTVATPGTVKATSSDAQVVAAPESPEVQIVISPLDEEDISIEADDEDDAKWIEEKSHCSFCKMFIFSPCKPQFKLWSQCVDSAKEKNEDFAAVCSDYTKALMNCTSANTEYFQALEQRNDDGEEEGAGGEAGTSTEEGESAAEMAAEEVEKIVDEDQ